MKKLIVITILFLAACKTERMWHNRELQPGKYPRKGCVLYPKPKFK